MKRKLWAWPKKAKKKIGGLKNVLNENRELLTNTYAKMLINELTKDKAKKKKGNFCFSKQKKFIINDSGPVPAYVGYSKDGNLIAVYCIPMIKNNNSRMNYEFQIKLLQNPKLEGMIFRYIDLEKDKKYIYLGVKLWDYTLGEYIRTFLPPPMTLKAIFKKFLHCLQSLHHARLIHGDINPKAVLIDHEKNVRLTIFDRNLLEDQAKENIYTRNCDIKDAGKLLYYILTNGKHPFGEIYNNVEDKVAQDLTEWMIYKDPAIDEVLKHSYFWDKKRKEEVIRKLGDLPESQQYKDISKMYEMRKADKSLTAIKAYEGVFGNKKKPAILGMLGETEEIQDENFKRLCRLCENVEKCTQGKTFNKWKSELSNVWPDIDKNLPEDLLGLLRVLRNKLTHSMGFDEKLFDRFPDFFISLHRLANDMGWDCTWS